MIPKEVIQKVRGIEIRTRRLVNDLFAGEYHSTFKGRGIEFDEVREYQPGDEIRLIDWNVTARMGRPFIKKFVEERELTVMLVVDMSGSERFGTQGRLKQELAAELCSILAFSAIRNNDKVGLIAFTDTIELYIPPKKGKKHVLRVISEVLSFSPKGRGTDLAGALEFLNSVVRRKAVTFLVSDFLATDFERELEVSNKRHDVVAVSIGDLRERELPDIGLIEFTDPETGARSLVDTADQKTRRLFAAEHLRETGERKKLLARADVDLVELETGSTYWEPLMRFFRSRERRR